MLPFLKLIRLPNLLIMAFTQYMVRLCVLMPLIDLMKHDIDYGPFDPQVMSEIDFFLLVLATMLIGAAGYIINDYFDVRIDEVNRPATNLVGKTIKRRIAIVTHTIFNVIGVMIGAYLSWKYHLLRVGLMLFISIPALLWFYSTKLKRQFLIGNLVIALLSGIVPIVVTLFESRNVNNYILDPENKVPESIAQACPNYLVEAMHITLVVALFAFIVSLLREIIKDVEDYEGDMEYGCKTMPIKIGIARTKIVLSVISGIIIAMIGWLQNRQVTGQEKDWSSFSYFTILIQLPLLYLIYRMMTAKGKKDWRFSSVMVKIIMVAGISYLFLYGHQIHQLLLVDAL